MRIGLPEDLSSYWKSVFPEDLVLYNSSLLRFDGVPGLPLPLLAHLMVDSQS